MFENGEKLRDRLTCTVYSVPSTPCTVYRVPCTVYHVPCTEYRVPCTVYLGPCTVHRVPCTVYRVPCTVYRVPCTVYRVPRTVYRVPCTVYCVPCTVYRVCVQAKVRFYAAVLAEEGAVQAGRLLLEEEEGREDDPRGPHEAQGPGHGGEVTFTHCPPHYFRT